MSSCCVKVLEETTASTALGIACRFYVYALLVLLLLILALRLTSFYSPVFHNTNEDDCCVGSSSKVSIRDIRR